MKKIICVPRINTNDDTIQVSKWLINDKEFIEEGKDLVRFETSKTIIDMQCESSGYILRHCENGDNVAVGGPLASIYSELVELEDDLKNENKVLSLKNNFEFEPGYNFSKFTVAAQEYIKMHQINPKIFEHLELVTIKIIQETLAQNEQFENSPIVRNDLDHKETIRIDNFKNFQIEKILRSKQLEIDYLSEGQSGGINSSLSIHFKSAQLRTFLKKSLDSDNQMLPYILFVLSEVLLEHPKLTAYFTPGQINYYNEINLGIAIDLGKGLKVPVIKRANSLSFKNLQTCIKNFIIDYYDDSLSIDDLTDSTITISDLSMDNILYFQPLINKRQSVVIGIGADKELEEYPMSITVVFDHRVLTGREVSEFLNAFKINLLDSASQSRRILNFNIK